MTVFHTDVMAIKALCKKNPLNLNALKCTVKSVFMLDVLFHGMFDLCKGLWRASKENCLARFIVNI